MYASGALSNIRRKRQQEGFNMQYQPEPPKITPSAAEKARIFMEAHGHKPTKAERQALFLASVTKEDLIEEANAIRKGSCAYRRVVTKNLALLEAIAMQCVPNNNPAKQAIRLIIEDINRANNDILKPALDFNRKKENENE